MLPILLLYPSNRNTRSVLAEEAREETTTRAATNSAADAEARHMADSSRKRLTRKDMSMEIITER